MAATKEWLIEQYGTVELDGRTFYLEDGDTWTDIESGQVYRGKGFDTGEVHHEGTAEDPMKGFATTQGYAQTHIIADMMRNRGYDSQENKGTGYYGRTLGNVYNEEDHTSLSRKLHSEGLTSVNRYTSKDDLEAFQSGAMTRNLLGDSNDSYYGHAREAYNTAKGLDYSRLKGMALNEQEFAGNPYMPNMYDRFMFRKNDRTMDNKAYSAFGTGLDSGWNHILGSIQGFKANIGDALNNDEMYKNGLLGVEEYENLNAQLPTYTNDIGSVNNIKEAGRYMSGMMGQALPYMLGIIGSAGAGSIVAGAAGLGAGAAFALGSVPPALTYAGSVYGSMEGDMQERNAGAALAAGMVMGILDRVGLHGLMSASSLLKKDGLEKVAIELQKKQGLSKAQATKKVRDAAFDVNQEVASAIGSVANIQLSKGILAKEFGTSFLQGAASEGVTEGLQETVEYGATVAGSKKEWNDEDYKRILLNAVTGGALLGGTIGSTLTTSKGYGSFRQIQRDFSEAADDVTKNFFGGGNNVEQLDKMYKYLEEKYNIKSIANTTRSIEDINQDLTDASKDDTTFRQKSSEDIKAESDADYKQGQKEDSVKHKGWFKTALELPGKAVQKGGGRLLEKYMESPDINDKSKYMLAVLMDTFAPSNKSHMPGMHLAKIKAVLMHTQLTHADMARSEFIQIFNVRKGGKAYDAKMKDFEGWLREKEAGKNNGPMHQKYRYMNDKLEILAGRIDAATDTLWNTHKGLVGDKRKPMKGYFFRSAVLNPNDVRKNKELFVQTLVEGWRSPGSGGKPGQFHKLTKDQAHQLWSDVVNGPDGYSYKDQSDVGFRNRKVGTLKSLELHLKDSQVMRDKFLESDHFEKLKSNIMSVVNHDMDVKTMGKNGIKLDSALVELKNEMGASWDPRINTLIKDSVAASRGDYKPIQNKFLASVQGHLTFIGTVTQLDTSMLASLPELGLLLLNKPRGVSIVKLLRDASGDLGRHYKRSVIETGQHIKSGLGIDMDTYTMNQLDFYNFGYDSAKHGVMGHMDIGQEIDHMSKFKSSMLQTFFTMNLLKPFTDGTRIAKLSMAQDAIIHDLEIVHQYLDGGSNYAADAYERLRDLNIDPIKLAEVYKSSIMTLRLDPTLFDQKTGRWIGNNDIVYDAISKRANTQLSKDAGDAVMTKEMEAIAPFKYLLDNLQTARNSYVDNALANPTAVDRPLWYSNPHFRLMTQYKGFISTFTSHILPRIWREVKHGNPEARYQAVAMAATMIMFGFLGQDLKDEWKYEDGYNPWIKQNGKIQRGLISSGLLGTPGELVNIINPIYDFKRDYVDLATEFAGPFTGTVANLTKTAESMISGDMNRTIYYGKKFTPLVGRWKGFNERGGSDEASF
jgi:hypothetical protein